MSSTCGVLKSQPITFTPNLYMTSIAVYENFHVQGSCRVSAIFQPCSLVT